MKTHGHRTRKRSSITYTSWRMMIQRCTNKKREDYERYGGRGILVYFDWMGPGGFESFLKDVGKRPSKAYSLDRINPNGNYEPGNVRWATKKVQANNRGGKFIEYDGERMTIYGWAEKLKYHPGALRKKISRLRLKLKHLFDWGLALVPNPRTVS